MRTFAITIKVSAEDQDAAADLFLGMLGMDRHSVNDIGGIEIVEVPA